MEPKRPATTANPSAHLTAALRDLAALRTEANLSSRELLDSAYEDTRRALETMSEVAAGPRLGGPGQAIRQVLGQTGLSVGDIRADLGLPTTQIVSALQSLAAEGLAVEQGGKWLLRSSPPACPECGEGDLLFVQAVRQLQPIRGWEAGFLDLGPVEEGDIEYTGIECQHCGAEPALELLQNPTPDDTGPADLS